MPKRPNTAIDNAANDTENPISDRENEDSPKRKKTSYSPSKDTILVPETPERSHGKKTNAPAKNVSFSPNNPILQQAAAPMPISQAITRRQAPPALIPSLIRKEAGNYYAASMGHNQTDYSYEKASLLDAIKACCNQIENNISILDAAKRLHKYYHLFEKCLENLKETPDNRLYIVIAKHLQKIPAQQRTPEDWQHIYNTFLKQIDSTANKEQIEFIEKALLEMSLDQSSSRDIYSSRLKALSTRAAQTNSVLSQSYHTFLGAMVDHAFTDAIDNFLALYAQYVINPVNTEKVNPRFFAKNYLELFKLAKENQHKLEQLQDVATAFIKENEEEFQYSYILEAYYANQAFLHEIKNEFASERECYILAIHNALITFEYDSENDDLSKEIASRLIHYSLLLKSSCVKQKSCTSDFALADSFLYIANKIRELHNNFVFANDGNRTLMEHANEMDAMIANLHAEHYESLKQQPDASWDEKYASILMAIAKNPQQYSHRFISMAIADMKWDKSSDNNVYYERLTVLNVKLFHSIRDSNEFSPEEKKEQYKDIHIALEQLKTRAQNGIRIATSPELIDSLNSWIGALKFFSNPPAKIKTFTQTIPNWRESLNNPVRKDNDFPAPTLSYSDSDAELDEYKQTGCFK